LVVYLKLNRAILVRIHNGQDSIKLRLLLTLLFSNGQVITQSSETRFEFIMAQFSRFVLVKMPEHHGELLELIFSDTRLVSGLDLLLKIVSDTHAQLVKLIPLLSQSNSRMLSVSVDFQNKELLLMVAS